MIHGREHFITYGGGPEGGFVYFGENREPGHHGWYSWNQEWGEVVSYENLLNQWLVLRQRAYYQCEVKIVSDGYVLQDDEEWLEPGESGLVSDSDENGVVSDTDNSSTTAGSSNTEDSICQQR